MPLDERNIAQKIREEHEHMKEAMARIKGMIGAEIPAGGYAKWRMDLLWTLRDCCTDMQKHFDLEEEGGFMHDVLRVAPHRSSAVEKLEDEHEQIQEGLEAVLRDLKAVEEQDEEKIARVCSDIQAIFDLIATHEEEESDLMMSTYMQDEGGGD